jgi:hypothetical protein
MERQRDQQGTPTRQNLRDLWDALRGAPRADGRGWLGAVLHEAKNVVVELVRAYPWHSIVIFAIALWILLDRIFTGDWL